MSSLVERLRYLSQLAFCEGHTGPILKAADRIEALEVALREIVRVDSSEPDLMDSYALEGVIAIARKALGEE